jgi:tRNA-intron endonuclease
LLYKENIPLEKIDVEIFSNNRLIVWNINKANLLYNKGYYGTPLGISKPREEFDLPLILDPVEGLYLLEKNIIQVTDRKKNYTPKQLLKIFKENYYNFHKKYLVYCDLREQGYVITPGIKYGCDFTVYEEGPGIDHAPFIVQIHGKNEKITASEIVKAGRLATTVRKSFILALVEEEIKYIEFNWWKA